MTAEIAILNKSAVALAADSAVTLHNGKKDKIYHTANKLFNLNKRFPVGIMIYNNAEFMGIPWDTIIKVYRTHCQPKEFDSIEEQCIDFIKFLESNEGMFSKIIQNQQIELHIWILFNQIKDNINIRIDDETKINPITPERVTEIVKELINTFKKNINSIKFLSQFNDDNVKEFLINHENEIQKIKNTVFDKLPISSSLFNELKQLSAQLFFKDYFNESFMSGIVIVGFGKKEFLPSLMDFQVEIAVDGKLKYKIGNKNFEVRGSLIQPYAQNEMALSFIQGISPYLSTTLLSGLTETIKKINENISTIKILDDLADTQKEILLEKIQEINKTLFDGFINEIQQLINARYIEPVINSVTSLPKEELAIMAEALVYLTYLRKRFSEELETVGGEIDVAVISKGDGFIWIKRKHYFKAELNPHFFKNYFK